MQRAQEGVEPPRSSAPLPFLNLDPRIGPPLRRARLWLTLTLALGVGRGALIVLQALVLSRAIARVFVFGGALADVAMEMQALLAIFLARAIVSWAGEIAAFRVAAGVKSELRDRLFRHIQTLGPAYVKGERTGELIHTLVEGIEALDAYLGQYFPQLVLAALVPLGILVFVFSLDPLSGVVLLATGPLIPLFMILIGKAADALTRKQWRSLRIMSAHFLDVLQGLATLKMLGQSRQQAAIIARVSERSRDATMGVLRVAFLSAFALEMIATISTAMVAVQVGLRLLYGQMQFEQAFFLLVLAPDYYLPLRLLGTRFHAGMAGATAVQRIFEILDKPASLEISVKHPAGGAGHAPQGVALKLECVGYGYDGERPALKGVSFEIGSGEHLALVGPTGAGKSTVASLLLRFIEPDSGMILWNDRDLRETPPRVWRDWVAWVPQHPYLFDETVEANIRFGRPGATEEAIIRAAQQAFADEFIRSLPLGYETRLGERGVRLSGGEAQRIALARAFIKDAPLVLFDEATAHLDPETAAEVQEAMARLIRGRTALVITHRRNTMAWADRIIVLEDGRVVETGTHATLLRAGGAYHRLVGEEAQAHG